ncbi:auxin-responsive protein SAUR71-like [Vitis riparia]|uniref:auxin-responsive protein SAUR71-like n=1 Tax=Vitis riparia TaxID=96939 RepID=UPI00155B3ED1|nr:auxin-responsive protein SAUR71-like [Vitis riparia]
MDSVKGKGKKNMAVKAWERCRVICGGAKKSAVNPFSPWSSFSKSKPSKRSEVDKPKTKSPVPPKGYFPVYVGAQKQRFVIKTQFANHSPFQMLLEEAEQEYGYSNEGPVLLLCEVDTFNKVLAEMNSGDHGLTPGCVFAKRHGCYSLLSPFRMLKVDRVQ